MTLLDKGFATYSCECRELGHDNRINHAPSIALFQVVLRLVEEQFRTSAPTGTGRETTMPLVKGQRHYQATSSGQSDGQPIMKQHQNALWQTS